MRGFYNCEIIDSVTRFAVLVKLGAVHSFRVTKDKVYIIIKK